MQKSLRSIFSGEGKSENLRRGGKMMGCLTVLHKWNGKVRIKFVPLWRWLLNDSFLSEKR